MATNKMNGLNTIRTVQ